MSIKPETPAALVAADTRPARPLGLWSATALVVGSMIGSGIFVLPASLAEYGGVSVLGWAVTLTGALMLALTFSKLATRWPESGGPHVYARKAFGETPGFLVAWSYWVSVWCANAAIAVAFAGAMGALYAPLTATPIRAAACAVGSLWLCTGINLMGMREAGRVQLLLTVLKFLPLLAFAGIAIWFVDRAHFAPFNRSELSMSGAVHATVALTLWALLGLEAATVPADSIENPERTVPRATVLGTLLAGVVTVLAVTSVLGIVPLDALKNSGAPMADAAALLWGRWAAIGIALVAAVSCLGALNGWVLISAQVPLAAAQKGLFPAIFARVDQHETPRFSILASTVLATVLVLSNYTRSLVSLFTFSILLSTATILLPYFAGSAAWLRTGESKGRWVALAALLYSAYALLGTGSEALLWGGVLLLAGLPMNLWMRYRG